MAAKNIADYQNKAYTEILAMLCFTTLDVRDYLRETPWKLIIAHNV